MGSSSSFPRREAGKEQIKQLAQETVTALQEAGFAAELSLLESRVFARAATDLFEAEPHPQGHRWTFKPMLELLLRHIKHLAEADTRPHDERRHEIDWAINASGY